MHKLVICGLLLSPLLFSLDSQAQSSLRTTSSYRDASMGLTHTYYQHEVNGYAILNTAASEHFNQYGVLVHKTGRLELIPAVAPAPQFQLSPASVLQKSCAHWGINYMSPPSDLVVKTQAVSFEIPAFSEEPITLQKGYFLQDGVLQTVWMVEAMPRETGVWNYLYLGDASGIVLGEGSYQAFCKHSQQHTANLLDSPATYRVYPFPTENPNDGAHTLLTEPDNHTGSPNGWHRISSPSSTPFLHLRGNNVFAFPDTAGNDISYPYPSLNFGNTYDFPYSGPAAEPRSYLRAASTQLFYANNYLHDLFYEYGFDEPSGNFQEFNLGKGGAANDAVQANAQDGSGTNNANFQSPRDGNKGRMQMYIWSKGPIPASLRIDSPSNIKANITAFYSNFGPAAPAEGLSGELVWVNDGGANSGHLGCDSLLNGPDLLGKIALIKGSSCNYTDVVYNAQAAGAIGVIVINHLATTTAFAMSGTDPRINIPSAMVPGSFESTFNNQFNQTKQIWVTMRGASNANFDSDLDNGVIAHEYGHGVSIRLTGGPSRSNCLQNAEQAGEGWSDFFALAFTAKPWDNLDAAHGMATWVNGEDSAGVGIRQYRYSRNMSVNPMTYNYVKTGLVPHGVGSVFCTMLWDLHQNLVEVYGFDPDLFNGTGGNNIAIQLVMDGLKLQPCSPGFVDSRNAILKADSIRYGGVHAELIWKTFARRGLGYSAKQGISTSRSDGTEAYDVPQEFWITGLNEPGTLALLNIYPNPAQDQLKVSVPTAEAGRLSITDLHGRTLLEIDVPAQKSQLQINIESLPAGAYFVRFNTEQGQRWEQKLLKAN